MNNVSGHIAILAERELQPHSCLSPPISASMETAASAGPGGRHGFSAPQPAGGAARTATAFDGVASLTTQPRWHDNCKRAEASGGLRRRTQRVWTRARAGYEGLHRPRHATLPVDNPTHPPGPRKVIKDCLCPKPVLPRRPRSGAAEADAHRNRTRHRPRSSPWRLRSFAADSVTPPPAVKRRRAAGASRSCGYTGSPRGAGTGRTRTAGRAAAAHPAP